MCKTKTTSARPSALVAACNQQQLQSEGGCAVSPTAAAVAAAATSTAGSPPVNSFFAPFYNPAFIQLANFACQLNPEPVGAQGASMPQQTSTTSFFPTALAPQTAPGFAPLPFMTQLNQCNAWFQQQQQQQALLNALATQTPPVPGGLDLLSKPSMNSASLPTSLLFDPSSLEMKKTSQPVQTTPQTKQPSASSKIPPSLVMQNSLSIVPTPEVTSKRASVKRAIPEMVSDSNSEHSDNDRIGDHVTKKPRASKKKHEATLDGERRVAIEFETLGSLGVLPQTYGKGALIVPDGITGKYSAFGQRWRFSITHAVGPVICEDGVQRMCLAWSVTNLNSGQTHTVVETPSDAMKRDRDGKTLCNRVFRDALSLRASALETELRHTNDASVCIDLQSQLRTIQTKRFSEGPLFFGLRHLSLQNEMRKELERRGKELSETSNAADKSM